MNRKEEASERMLNEIEASQLSDIEFKTMVMWKLTELSMNYQKIQGSYEELTANYISMKKHIETINKSQEELEKTISELNNTAEGLKSRLGEAENLTSKLEDKVKKKLPKTAQKGKKDSKVTNRVKGTAGQHDM